MGGVTDSNIRPTKRETSLSSGFLFKGRGRPLLFTMYVLFAISFEDCGNALDAHCG